jgi:hypothetical protein
MSTTTVTVRSTIQDVSIEELRRREAEARESARMAARRAEDQRRQEEGIRRRMNAANAIIAEQEGRFQSEVARLDESVQRLPDMALSAPVLPVMSGDIARDPDRLEDHAAHLSGMVQRFSQQLDHQIERAERVLARRVAKAAAWRSAADLQGQLDLRIQSCREAARRLGEPFTASPAPEKPQDEAELEAVEAYVAALLELVNVASHQSTRLQMRAFSRERATDLGGTRVHGSGSDESLSRHEEQKITDARNTLGACLDAALSIAHLHRADLPGAVCIMIDDAFAQAHIQDHSERITRWIAREKQYRDGVQRSLTLMQSAPCLVHDDPALSVRWNALLGKLQRIAGGLEAFTPSVEREYEQIHKDSRLMQNRAFALADLIQAMNDQGFEIYDREDGKGLVLIDLDHPAAWLEVTELESDQGGFASHLDLKTDETLSSTQEAAVASEICRKLVRASESAKTGVTSQAVVVDHETSIKRGRRPAKARQLYSKSL